MPPLYRLLVESGPDKGKSFAISESGCSVGRSSHNDLPLLDEQLSRLHCRFQFRKEELWVTDLASANGTEVDGVEIDEKKVVPGNRIRVGETVLLLEKAGEEGAAAGKPSAGDSEGGKTVPDATAPAVDLGFSGAMEGEAPVARLQKRTIIWAVSSFVGLLILAGLLRWMLEAPPGAATVQPLRSDARPRMLELRYEKIEGSAENIFRYDLALNERGRLTVSIDDLSQSRHVRRESPAPVEAELLERLGRQLEDSGFFALEASYEGVALPNSLASYDLTVVLGEKVHRVRVLNRSEPEEFLNARERIETFVRNELGLWAVEFSRERLESMARDAYMLGVKLVQEKDIQAGNLFSAARSFQECINFLDTVDPKPDFFEEAVSGLREARDETQRRYTEQNFRADRAIKLKDWERAASELRGLFELIPDRTDDRYKDAERRLLDVEARLKQRSSR